MPATRPRCKAESWTSESSCRFPLLGVCPVIDSSKRIPIGSSRNDWRSTLVLFEGREAQRSAACRLPQTPFLESAAACAAYSGFVFAEAFASSKSQPVQANLKPNLSRPRSKRTCSDHSGAGAPEQYSHRLGLACLSLCASALRSTLEPARDAQDICTREWRDFEAWLCCEQVKRRAELCRSCDVCGLAVERFGKRGIIDCRVLNPGQ